MNKCPKCGAPARHMPPDGDFRYDPPALRAATSPAGDLVEQEPVAWRYSSGPGADDWTVTTDRELAYRKHDERVLVEPIYTAQALRYQSTGVTEITDEMIFAAMEKADELGEPLDDIDTREILAAALSAQERG